MSTEAKGGLFFRSIQNFWQRISQKYFKNAIARNFELVSESFIANFLIAGNSWFIFWQPSFFDGTKRLYLRKVNVFSILESGSFVCFFFVQFTANSFRITSAFSLVMFERAIALLRISFFSLDNFAISYLLKYNLINLLKV